MPIPKPSKDEKEADFISRCMGDETMNTEYPDEKKRNAICQSQWKNSKEQKRDEMGRLIVAENVKFIIGAKIEADENEQ